MNINNQDLEAFLVQAQLISQKVKGLANNTISPEEIDKLELRRAEDKKRRDDFKVKKERQAHEMKVKGRQGKGITKDFSNFCRFCHRQYELETPTCWKCNRPTMTLEERQAQLHNMVEDYKFNKANRQEKRQKWEMFQKTQAALWKKSSIDYSKKWDYFVQQSDQEPQKEPIVPQNDPNFKALQADIEERKKRRAKDTENAKRLKDKGNAAMKEGQYQNAIEFYTLALEHIKDIKSIYTNRALAYIKLRKFKKAIKDCTNVIQYMQVFQKVGENKDLMFKALSRRALSKKEIKDYKEALEDVNQALKLSPNDSNVLLLKKEIEGFVQHTETVQKLIRQNREKQNASTSQKKEPQSEEEDGQNVEKLEKQIVKELAQEQIAQTKAQQEKKVKVASQALKQENPIKQIPTRLQALNQENLQYLFTLLLKNKELKNIFVASKGIQKTLDYLFAHQSPKNEGLLIYMCLQGDGVAQKRLWDWGIPKIYEKILSKFTDQSKLNLSVYAFVDNLLQILVPVTLSDIYRPQIAAEKRTYDFIQAMFPKLITKYKKQPQLLDNFMTFFSNLCSGDSALKNTYLKKDKVSVIWDSLYMFILSHKTKNRLILDLKQSVYSLIANIITNLEHRKGYVQFLQKNDRLQDLKQQLQLYPKAAHNFDPYIENVLSVTANAFLDCPIEANQLSEAIFGRFIVNWEQYNGTIVYRALLTIGRVKYTSNQNLPKWMKTFDKMAVKIDPLTNTEDKNIGQVVKILNIMIMLNGPQSITEIPKNLMNLLEKLVQKNNINEQLFCNTCNLFGILIDKKNTLSEKILNVLVGIVGRLVEVAKEKVGNWRKSAAILLGKCAFNPQCRAELDRHHGMEVLKSIASFVTK